MAASDPANGVDHVLPIDPDTGPVRAKVLAAISAGGALGALARYGVDVAFATRPGTFPAGTLLVNTSGCLALGVLLVLVFEVWPPTHYVRPFAAVGFIGSYTTFSSLVVQSVLLARADRPAIAALYVAATVAAGLAATWVGIAAGWSIARRDGGSTP